MNAHNLALYVTEINMTKVYIQFLPMSFCGLELNHLFLRRERETGTVKLSQ